MQIDEIWGNDCVEIDQRGAPERSNSFFDVNPNPSPETAIGDGIAVLVQVKSLPASSVSTAETPVASSFQSGAVAVAMSRTMGRRFAAQNRRYRRERRLSTATILHRGPETPATYHSFFQKYPRGVPNPLRLLGRP